jgi:hypothetical protein
LGFLFLGPLPTKRDVPPATFEHIFVWGRYSFGIMLSAAALAWWWLKREQRLNAMLALGLGTFLGLSVLLVGFDIAREVRSGFDLAEQIKPHHDSSKPFYNVDDYDQTIPFYLQRTTTLVEYRNELDFGLTQEPAKGLPDRAAFKAAWEKDPSGSIAVMPHATYTALAGEGLPMTIIGRNIESTAVIKP